MPGAGGGADGGGPQVLVLAAVTGQPGDDPLDVANQVDEQLLDAVASGLREVPVTAAGRRGRPRVTLPWSQHGCRWSPPAPISLLAWPGQEPRVAVATGAAAPRHAGRGPGRAPCRRRSAHERVAVPVRVADSLGGPSVQLAPEAILS